MYNLMHMPAGVCPVTHVSSDECVFPMPASPDKLDRIAAQVRGLCSCALVCRMLHLCVMPFSFSTQIMEGATGLPYTVQVCLVLRCCFVLLLLLLTQASWSACVCVGIVCILCSLFRLPRCRLPTKLFCA